MAGAAAAMVAAFLLSRVISRPLTALAEGTRRLSGEGSRHLELPSADSGVREFAELHAGFRQMAEALRAQYEGLEAKVAERTRDLEQALREARAAGVRLQAQEEIRRGYGELAALLNSLDRSYVLQEGTRKIAASVRAPLAAVYLREDGSDRLLLKTYAALDPAPLQTATLSPEGVPAEVARRREPLIVAPPQGADRLTVSTGVGTVELAAVAALPLQYQDRLLGVLVVALPEPPTEDTRGFLDSAASQLSVALSNSALFESVRHQSQQVEQLNVALLRASEAKSQFLASMSHELRTPLNAIIGFTDLLLMGGRDPLTARQQTALEKVRESGKHLLGLINQVLDLSKIEAGRMEIRAEAFPLAPLVQECLATVEPQATAKGLHLAAVGLEAAPELVQDRVRVKQILLNLLANAVKFTTEGSVEVRVASALADAVAIAVMDTGPGIPAGEQEAVFDEFRQLAPDRAAGGTGLGLPIGRRLAALLGGTLTLESTPGCGSVFTLRLPRRLGRPASTTAAPRDEGDDFDLPPDAPEILLIDDDRNVFDIVRGALTGEPIRVEWTPRADDGLARARAEQPRLVLLDVMLQGRDDGWETLRALKSDPVTRDIPVVLHSVIDNPERARQLGAVGVLPKPVTAIAIKSLVQSLINGPPRASGDEHDES
jgi:signal transduction histidine kinase/ActR/RegA family two-component response regulator